MQPYPYRTPYWSIPPGKYNHSDNLLEMMQSIAPIYTIPTEPVFFDQLLKNVGKTIRIVTLNGSFEGKLTGVAIDHLQLTIGDANYHVRFAHISFFVTKK